MTDGIIQEAFKKSILFYSARASDEISTMVDAKDVYADLQCLQQELIEKIKQNAHTEQLSDYPHLTLKELIGDNK